MPPERVAHFRILDQLGQGGMGVVYRAEDERLGRRVALKLLKPGGDAELRARFLREARAAAAVSHPNVATIFEIADDGDDVSIAMELIEGATLRAALDVGPLAPARALAIATAIADGLAHAHELGVVHRDLKPENVMLAKGDRPKILDFGLARLVPAGDPALDDTAAVLTTAGQVMGTPAYMSPEQARGDRVDARGDVFSFGVLFFELLIGRRPFEGRTGADLTAAILVGQVPAPSSLNPAVAASLDAVVLRCLAKEPADRYPDGAALLAALRAAALHPVRRQGHGRLEAAGAVAVVCVAAAGAALAVAVVRHRHGRSRAATTELVRRLRGSSAISLTADGKLLAIADGSLVIDDRAHGEMRVEPGAAAFVEWFPDDDRLLVGVTATDGLDLEVYSSFTREVRPLAIHPLVVPALDRDGARLAWFDAAHALHVSDLSGDGDRLVGATGLEAAWSPSDRRLAFAGTDAGLYTVPAGGGPVVRVPIGGEIEGLRWLAGGLVFSRVTDATTSELDEVSIDDAGRSGAVRRLADLHGAWIEPAAITGTADELLYVLSTESSHLLRASLADTPLRPVRAVEETDERYGYFAPGGIVVQELRAGRPEVDVVGDDGHARTLFADAARWTTLLGVTGDGAVVETLAPGADLADLALVPWRGAPAPLVSLDHLDRVWCAPARCAYGHLDDAGRMHVRDLDAKTGAPDLVVLDPAADPLALSDDGRVLAVRLGDGLATFDLGTGARTDRPLPANQRLRDGWFYPDGRFLACVAIDLDDHRSATAIVDVSSQRTLWTDIDDDALMDPVVSPDGATLLFVRQSWRAELWRATGLD